MAVPQLERVVATHSRSFFPAEAASVDRGQAVDGIVRQTFPATTSIYVVLERNEPLQPGDRQLLRQAGGRAGADTEHVCSVTDLWAVPLTAAAAQSETAMQPT